MNPHDPHPTLTELGLGIVLGGAVLVGCVFLLWFRGMGIGVASPGGVLAAIALQSLAILAALLPLALSRGRRVFAVLGLEDAAGARAYLWLPLVFMGAMAGHALVLAVQTMSGRSVETPGAAMLDTVAGQPGGIAALVIGVVILAPLGEELLFRGLVYGWLRRMLSFTPAAVLQAVPFGLLHGTLDYTIYASLLGVVLALVRERTGSLRVCIAAHMLVNAGAIAFVYLGTVAIDPGSPGP